LTFLPSDPADVATTAFGCLAKRSEPTVESQF